VTHRFGVSSPPSAERRHVPAEAARTRSKAVCAEKAGLFGSVRSCLQERLTAERKDENDNETRLKNERQNADTIEVS
jgi:hypothetical protein